MESRTILSCFSRSKPVSARSRMQRLLGWSHLNAKHLGLCSGFLCIYTYERLLSFAGGRFTAPAIQHGKMTLSKKARNSKRPFVEARWLVEPGQTLWNKCVSWCDWNCSSATVISVLLQSSQHWHYPRLSVQCCSIENLNSLVFGRIASFKHAAPTHVCFDLAKPTFGTVVYMCKERYHPIPNPPHHDLRTTTDTQA